MKRKSFFLTIVLVLVQFCSGVLWAGPTTANDAKKVVTGWLKADHRPLGTALGLQVVSVETFTNDIGELIYYIVYLQPSGFVIVPADNSVQPIIGFVERGIYDPSLDNPLGALVTNDLNGRIAAVRNIQGLEATDAMQAVLESQAKWEQLMSLGEAVSVSAILGLPSVSDPRVDPLLQSKWGQTTCCAPQGDPNALACYNYYTPQLDTIMGVVVWNPGDPNNYPCGCLATAMAQLMRFHQHPQAGIGRQQFSIYFNYSPWSEYAWTRGGDGLGGRYNWNLMVYEPNCSTTVAQRQAIGALCYDAGVSVSMTYDANGSTAWGPGAAFKLRDPNIFDYNNAVTSNMGPNIPVLIDMINPNLDYSHPVILIVSDNPYDEMGHAVLADGYGYNLLTLYHHINMGWEGQYDAWYNLPDVYDYNQVSCCIYNVFVSGTGEIISGRVTDTSGAPISGAAVTAQGPGGPYNAATNGRGIYALAHLQSASTYTISVVKAGYTFAPKAVNTGTSSDWSATSGNVWAVDFTPLIPTVIYVDMNAPGINDGSSWYNAYNYLQDALADPSAWKILVAEGSYCPDQGAGQTPGNRYASFVLRNGVAIYGGYAGYGTPDPNARDVKLYETILSGDLAGNDPYRAENSYNVVTSNNTDETAILDGCIITAGNANTLSVWPTSNGGGMLNVNSNCTVNKCTFIDNYAELGGAIYNHYSNAHISNCIFFRNSSKYDSGGISNDGASCPILVNCSFISNCTGGNGGGLGNFGNSNPTVVNCSFSNNSANWGGALANIDASCPTITNCTFSCNWANTCDGGIHNYNNCFPTINNCILWNNTSLQIGDSGGSAATVNYSDVQGGWTGTGIGNINNDPCFVEPEPCDLIEAMISYWNFDEGFGTTANECINDNDGTISGATWTTGKVGPALYFNSNSVTVPHSSSLDITGPFTVEAWIKAVGTDNYNMIVDKFSISTPLSYGFSFYLSNGNLKLSLYSGADGNGGVSGTTELRDDAWHHVAGFWDGSHIRIYIDGVFEAESSWAYPPGSTTNDLGIGKRLSCHGGCLYFKGTIDEVAIYNKALGMAEIQQDYQNGLAGHGLAGHGNVGTVEGDYHLQHNSPCIDVGDNASVPPDTIDLDNDGNTTEQTPLDLDGHPRFADGDCNDTIIVDMGAYEFAYVYIGDFDGECDVDFVDFAILASYWLQNAPLVDIVPPPAGDGIVDMKDLAVLCNNWLAGIE